MLIKLNDQDQRPTDFFLYAQNDTTLEIFGFTLNSEFSEMVVEEIEPGATQKCLPPSYGDYLTISEITSILETMKPTALAEMSEDIETLRKFIGNTRFPFTVPGGARYYVLCAEGEHRDLIKGARRKAERDPSYTHTWIMVDADDNPQFIFLDNAQLIELANAWEDWGGDLFEMSVQMKMSLQTMRYEQIKTFDVDFTSLTSL